MSLFSLKDLTLLERERSGSKTTPFPRDHAEVWPFLSIRGVKRLAEAVDCVVI